MCHVTILELALYNVHVLVFLIPDPPLAGTGLRQGLASVGSKKPRASSLHGVVVKMGRVVWAKELKYLHPHLDTSTNGWGALISTKKCDKKRATINDDPGVPNASIDLEIDVDKRGKNVEVVTPAEVVQLK